MRAAQGAPHRELYNRVLTKRDASVFVVFQRFADVLRQFARRAEVLRLEPTSRSLLR